MHTRKIKSAAKTALFYGVDGSRTRVQKPIPCPSTIIVCLFAAGLAPARSLLNPGADTLIHSVAS